MAYPEPIRYRDVHTSIEYEWVTVHGLLGSIYIAGIEKLWIGIGLAIGTYFTWLIVIRRLKVYSEKAGNSLTLSQYFENRFHEYKGCLRTLSAVIILVYFTICVASGFVGAGNVFRVIFPDFSYTAAMLISAAVVIVYTFLGGFKAICWIDLIQRMLMLFAVTLMPLAVLHELGGWSNAIDILNNSTTCPTISSACSSQREARSE